MSNRVELLFPGHGYVSPRMITYEVWGLDGTYRSELGMADVRSPYAVNHLLAADIIRANSGSQVRFANGHTATVWWIESDSLVEFRYYTGGELPDGLVWWVEDQIRYVEAYADIGGDVGEATQRRLVRTLLDVSDTIGQRISVQGGIATTDGMGVTLSALGRGGGQEDTETFFGSTRYPMVREGGTENLWTISYAPGYREYGSDYVGLSPDTTEFYNEFAPPVSPNRWWDPGLIHTNTEGDQIEGPSVFPSTAVGWYVYTRPLPVYVDGELFVIWRFRYEGEGGGPSMRWRIQIGRGMLGTQARTLPPYCATMLGLPTPVGQPVELRVIQYEQAILYEHVIWRYRGIGDAPSYVDGATTIEFGINSGLMGLFTQSLANRFAYPVHLVPITPGRVGYRTPVLEEGDAPLAITSRWLPRAETITLDPRNEAYAGTCDIEIVYPVSVANLREFQWVEIDGFLWRMNTTDVPVETTLEVNNSTVAESWYPPRGEGKYRTPVTGTGEGGLSRYYTLLPFMRFHRDPSPRWEEDTATVIDGPNADAVWAKLDTANHWNVIPRDPEISNRWDLYRNDSYQGRSTAPRFEKRRTERGAYVFYAPAEITTRTFSGPVTEVWWSGPDRDTRVMINTRTLFSDPWSQSAAPSDGQRWKSSGGDTNSAGRVKLAHLFEPVAYRESPFLGSLPAEEQAKYREWAEYRAVDPQNPCVRINVYDVILQLLCSTGGGWNGPFDRLPVDLGFGIPWSSIDTAAFHAAASLGPVAQVSVLDYMVLENVVISGDDLKDPRKWLEESILTPLFIGLTTSSKGLIRPFDPVGLASRSSDDSYVIEPTGLRGKGDSITENGVEYSLDNLTSGMKYVQPGLSRVSRVDRREDWPVLVTGAREASPDTYSYLGTTLWQRADLPVGMAIDSEGMTPALTSTFFRQVQSSPMTLECPYRMTDMGAMTWRIGAYIGIYSRVCPIMTFELAGTLSAGDFVTVDSDQYLADDGVGNVEATVGVVIDVVDQIRYGTQIVRVLLSPQTTIGNRQWGAAARFDYDGVGSIITLSMRDFTYSGRTLSNTYTSRDITGYDVGDIVYAVDSWFRPASGYLEIMGINMEDNTVTLSGSLGAPAGGYILLHAPLHTQVNQDVRRRYAYADVHPYGALQR